MFLKRYHKNIHSSFMEHFLVTLYIIWVLTLLKNKYNVLIVFLLYCKTLFLLLRWDTGKQWRLVKMIVGGAE